MEFERRRESPMGYHFLHLYQLCAWKFFIKYVLGITSQYTATPLLLGGAFHDAKAHFYLGGSERECLNMLEEQLESSASDLENPDNIDVLIIKLQAMFKNWVMEFGSQDLKDYNILGVELQMKPSLPNGYITTVRCDAVLGLKDKSGALLEESKTTRWNPQLTYNGLEMSDQITSYLYALRQCHPEWNVIGCLPTIVYGNQGQIHSHRFDLIHRTDKDLFDFEAQTMNLMAEITQKIRAINDYPWVALFPRDTQWCTSFYRPCEYFYICRQTLTDVPPPGFVKDEWSDFDSIVNMDYDLLDVVEVEVADE
jgi:hypothetical protein